MSVDRTLPQGSEELLRAKERSLQRLKPPTQVPGYDFEAFLGEGAYGEVWVAVDRNTGRRVAIKFYAHRGGLDWSLLSREVEKLAFLFADRYVVQLFDVGWDASPPYYIMEYLPHGSLADRLAAGTLPADEAVELWREVCIGLVHAHGKGVLHCDLKPGNVLLDQDMRPRLADFGQSRLSHEQLPALGTLFYMAPEQADLKAQPDAKWDVYALGALLYAMLTGSPPYRDEESQATVENCADLESRLAAYRRLIREAPRPKAHRRVPGVDRALADILERCLAPNPNKRYANPQAVLDALDERELRRARRPMLVMGALGPVLVLAVMLLFAWGAVGTTVRQSEAALSQRALETNSFAAQFVAETVASQIDRRWEALEQIARDPDFMATLTGAFDQPRGSAERNRLQEMIEKVHYDHWEFNATSWFVNDADGIQIARSPLDEKTIDRDYSWRDYFQGAGHDKPADTSGWEPIRQVHRSHVIQSQATGNRMVAFSVPIWSSPNADQQREIIGVLALTMELGHFAEMRSENPSASNQLAVLVDTREDWTGRRGSILEHPALVSMRQQNVGKLPKVYLSDAQVALIQQLRELERKPLTIRERPELAFNLSTTDDYVDPIGGAYGDRWLAAIEPVMVLGRATEVQDTGWAVIIQERHAAAIEPAKDLGWRLAKMGLIALGLVVVVVTVLWGFVVFVLNESPRSRLARLVRGRSPSISHTYSGATGLSSMNRSDRDPDTPNSTLHEQAL